MSVKPATSQSCNTQSCTQSVSVPWNGGWGGTVSASWNAPVKPKSISISGSCDDWAILWINGTVVYNRGGCSCGGDCCEGFGVTRYDLGVVGNNTVSFQCIDQCGGSSGGGIYVTVNY